MFRNFFQDRTGTDGTLARTGGDQRLKRVLNAQQTLDLDIHVVQLGDGAQPHIGAVAVRIGSQLHQLLNIAQREADLLGVADETNLFNGVEIVFTIATHGRHGLRNQTAPFVEPDGFHAYVGGFCGLAYGATHDLRLLLADHPTLRTVVRSQRPLRD